MKLKTTNKAIREGANKIISIGYCEAQYLLRGVEPFAYTCGVYGHNADFYDIAGVVISTGYRPIGERKSYGVTSKYEAKARAIWEDARPYGEYGYEQRKADAWNALIDFINT